MKNAQAWGIPDQLRRVGTTAAAAAGDDRLDRSCKSHDARGGEETWYREGEGERRKEQKIGAGPRLCSGD